VAFRVLRARAHLDPPGFSVIFIIPWAVPSIPTIFSIRFMFNPEWA